MQTSPIKGLEELRERLRLIPEDMGRRGFKSALRKAALVIAEEARARAESINDPQTGRSISANVGVRFGSRYSKSTGDLMYRVGIQGGARVKDGKDTSAGAPTPHWRLIEFGTYKMAARPFFRPAMSAKAQQAFDTFATEADAALARAAKRYFKRGR